MMPTITIQPVSRVRRAAFVRAVNAAYEGYYVPIVLTPHSFGELVRRESVELSRSAAALDGGRVVGMGLLGVRGAHGWIGGMGVIPAYRRQGIARRVMKYLIGQGADAGLRRLQLEVIVENSGAYHLYESLGFQVERQLHVLVREEGPSPPAPNGTGLIVKPAAVGRLLARLPALAGTPRPWQREAESIYALGRDLRGVAAFREGTQAPVGVCFYHAERYHVGLVDVAADTLEAGSALLAHLLAEFPLARITYLNIAEDDPLFPLLRGLGFRSTLSQHEMTLPLNQEQPNR
jgi:ribosomal protein S18 acetylase RimI-like enzyme